MVTVGHVIIDSASKDKERGTALSWQWGLWAPRILPETTKSPPVWPSEPGYGGAKISGDPVQSVFAGHSGGTTTCEHSQELTPELLELKVTGVFTASMPLSFSLNVLSI